MKNFQYKSKVFFWSGIIMLVVAGGVWAATGGIGRALRAYADAETGTDSNPGSYSEKWLANEIFGLYRFGLYDDEGIDNNGWAGVTGKRDCTVTATPYPGEDRYYSSNLVGNNSTSITDSNYCGYKTTAFYEGVNPPANHIGEGALDPVHNMTVTEWIVNGHVH